jgi:hypothetical protein
VEVAESLLALDLVAVRALVVVWPSEDKNKTKRKIEKKKSRKKETA